MSAIKVLLVDDDEDDFFITKEIIEDIPNRRYTLEWEPNSEQALSIISDNQHHIYLVDFHLGAINGLELIKKAITAGNNAPFILLTGQGDVEIDEQALQIGATDYLVKGTFSPFELDRSIRYSIEHKKNLIKIQQLNQELEQRVEERTLELASSIQKLEAANAELKSQVRVRKIAEDALRESQYLYSAIAHNFPNGAISVYDRQLQFVLIDGSELQELNLSTRELIGQKITVLFPEDTGRYVERELMEVFQGVSKSFEVPYRDRDYILHATPLPSDDEQYNQILVVTENITDRKKAELEVRRALQKEKELNELKSRFVTMASHEFRTPLSTILSSSSLINKYTEGDQQDKRGKHVDRIKSNVNHLNRLLNDFLSLGKLEEGLTKNHPSYFSLTELCNILIDEIQLMAKPDQSIDISILGEEREVYLDKQLLRNILINLLSNAVKYSPNGKNVDLRLIFDDKCVAIEVEDKGIGIPENEQEHLFERFFRAKNTTNIQGTGLGLNIVKKYVELMDGKIELSSQLNVGTKAKLMFENI